MTKLLKIAAFAVPACAMLALAQPAGAAGGAPAAAAASSTAGSTSGTQAKATGTKKVCINVVMDTGSRMTRRMCKTKAEWADEGVDLDARK
jgi:hypothetical protein